MRRLLVVLAVLFAVSTAHAQETPVTVGLGASLESTTIVGDEFALLGGLDIYVPVQIGQNFRVEPSIGYASTSESTEAISSSQSILRIGVGFFYVQPLTDQTLWYVGPRIGLLLVDREREAGGEVNSISQTNTRLGLSAGGEHFLSEQFSIGGEVQLNHIFVGQPETDDGPGNGTEIEESATRTRALFFIRWYFGDMDL